MKIIKFNGWECLVQVKPYYNGGYSLSLIDASDFEPVATATSWIPGLYPDEVAVKDYSENEGMLIALESQGVIETPHRKINNGFMIFPIARLKDRELWEFKG